MGIIQANQKTCQTCGAALRGRSDKKFCNDYCRNQYNNEQKASVRQHPVVRNVNNALLRNRKILNGFLEEEETTRVSREKMLEMGFVFRYMTENYCTRNGNHYHYCYDLGYRQLENGWVIIVRKKEI
jgi:predicted nucleic acid-binding Zn ribbon protein